MLRFIEAKDYHNNEISGTEPKVIRQVHNYRERVDSKKANILRQYEEYIRIVNRLFTLHLPDEIRMDDQPVALYVFGFDEDRNKGGVRDLKEKMGKENIPLYTLGGIKKLTQKHFGIKRMNFTVHRGSHEIGGSCVEVQHGKTRIILDIGMPLVDTDGSRFDSAKVKGKSVSDLLNEGILPKVRALYKGDSSDNPVDAVLISHAHLDHCGLIEHVQDGIPLYAGEGTKKIIYLNSVFLNQRDLRNSSVALVSGSPFKIGSLTITPYLMDHSAFDAYAFVIEGGDKTVIYSGDFRGHGRKAKAFEYFLKIAPRGGDALLLEGSVLGRSDSTTLTESKLREKTTDILNSSDNIVFVYPSSQNIDRLVTLYKAACEAKRDFVIDVYTADVLDTLKDTPRVNKLPHPSKQYGSIRVYFPRKTCKRLEQINRKDLMTKFRDFSIRREEISDKRGGILMTIRPSVMDYISKIEGIKKSTVIYSMWEGYKEYDSMKRFFSVLKRKNVDIIDLNTSGHASINTVRRVAKTLRPKRLIPIHTFYPEEYLSLFENVEIIGDGQEIAL